jgi:twitching motility protein PilI
VVEILPLPPLTAVPGALSWMLGVANIRGALLPVVDLKQFLEGERTVLHERQRVLVVRQPGGDVAVTIDELYGQRSFVEEHGIDPDAVADGRYAHFVDRAYRMNDQDWGVFSLERLARTPEFRQAAA